MKRIRINAGSRLHFGLLDLTGDLGRVDGGIGLYLSKPRMIIEAGQSSITKSNSNTELVRHAVNQLNEHFGRNTHLDVKIIEFYGQHVGLGSSTQLLLSLGKAYCQLNKVSCSVRELATILGRGSTSGIGVAGFERGGFIMDAGHPFGPGKNKDNFLPSRASSSSPAPVVFQRDFPREWVIEIIVPERGPGLSGEEEVDFFKKNCPISSTESDSIARIVISCVLPGVIEGDIETFARGINLLTTLGFKKREIDNQFNDLKLTLQNLKVITQNTAAIGLSSFGPTLFIIWNTEMKNKYITDVKREINHLLGRHGGKSYTTRSRNTGAISDWVDN